MIGVTAYKLSWNLHFLLQILQGTNTYYTAQVKLMNQKKVLG